MVSLCSSLRCCPVIYRNQARFQRLFSVARCAKRLEMGSGYSGTTGRQQRGERSILDRMDECLVSIRTTRAEYWLGWCRPAETEDIIRVMDLATPRGEFLEVHLFSAKLTIDGEPLKGCSNRPGWLLALEYEMMVVTVDHPWGLAKWPPVERVRKTAPVSLLRKIMRRLCA